MCVIESGGEGDCVGWYARYLDVLSLWGVGEWGTDDQVITDIPSDISYNFYAIWASIGSLG